MLFEKIETPGLAHFSYIIGDQNRAVVIDPRRDCKIYHRLATNKGYQIKYILETHRNEDYLIGSRELKQATGAEIWHADNHLDYEYGRRVEEGKSWQVGRLKLEALHTPGHTDNSFSYLLYGFKGEPIMVFTGDLLFAGDVGRVDLLGEERIREMSEKLYDSIYNKILPLGDGVIMCPAHGAGSVCGNTIAERELTTIGLEKQLNPHLQYPDKQSFIQNIGQVLSRPPYFRQMEKLNLTGSTPLDQLPAPPALTPAEFEGKLRGEDIIIVDTRDELSFASAHIPGSISIWQEGLASFAGWFLSYDRELLIVNQGGFPKQTIDTLHRLGFDRIVGYLSGGLLKWHMAGKTSTSIRTIKVEELCSLIDRSADYWLLDIRTEEEIAENGELQDAHNLPLTQLPDNMAEIPEDRPVYIFCGSGLRSTTAASLLKNNGFDNIHVILGGLAGWSSTTCPVV